ncbi:hypothetical protein F4808DRAFT_231209 [Astrocystis sublimbata]|nr:hypothetical protein F4808DRAFT_231209 [Astrocystis sublimbata]
MFVLAIDRLLPRDSPSRAARIMHTTMLLPRQDAAGSAKTPCLVTTALVVVAVIFPLLSFGAITLRFYARGQSRAKLMADDWWMVAGWIFASSLSIPIWVYGSITGIDYYKIDPLEGTTYSLQSLYVASILTLPALAIVKISILLFYKRVFSIYTFKIIVWVLIALLGAWCIIFILLTALQGDPLDSPWKLTGGFRYDITAIGYAQVGSNIALDFIVLSLPLPVISKLRMARTRKISLSLILWLGAFNTIEAVRLPSHRTTRRHHRRVPTLLWPAYKRTRGESTRVHCAQCPVHYLTREPGITRVTRIRRLSRQQAQDEQAKRYTDSCHERFAGWGVSDGTRGLRNCW